MDLDPPPPYEPPSGSGDDGNVDNKVDDNVGANVDDSVDNNVPSVDDNVLSVDNNVPSADDNVPSVDNNAPSVSWARYHLLDARTALASYPFATRALQRQVLEEQEVIRLGIEHLGPPPAHTNRIIVTTEKDSARVERTVPTSSMFGPFNIEAQLDDAIRYGAFGRDHLMPGLPRRRDPLRDAFGGVQTMAVRNPSVQWGAMVPRRHFPGAEVEGVIPEMESTPEYVIVRRHVCGTECLDGCHQGGGVRKKGKGKATPEVGDVDGGEAMEGVVYAHWGDDSFDESEDSGSDQERQEKLREQQELETIETLEHCTTIERHRRKWAAEIGALTDKARIMTEKLPSIRINTKEPKQMVEVDEPSFYLVGKMANRVDNKRDRADRIKQERLRMQKIRLVNWRARMAGRDTTELRDEAAVAVFNSLVDSGSLGAPPIRGSDNAAFGPAPRSPDKEDSAIDDSPESTVITENLPTSDSDRARPLQHSHPTAKSTEEVVSDPAEEEENKFQETASREDVPEEIRSLEATLQDTPVGESIAQAFIAQTAIARDATSTDPALEETPILDSAPQETTFGEAAPEDTASEKSALKKAAHEDTTTEKATAEETSAQETSAQETLGPGPGPSRKRPAPKKSSLKRRPAKRQSIRESPFLDPSEREKPPVWILQRDGRVIRNPLADAHSGPQAGRRWSDPDIDAPVPMPPSDSEPRSRSATISEGTEPPVPRCSAGDTLPSIGNEGQITEHIEVVGESPAPMSPAERALADRELMPPPPRPAPRPRRRKRSLAVSEGSPNESRLWSPDDMFPSIEILSQAAEQSASGGDSAADVTSLAPARASTPEPPQMSREEIRTSARTLATLLEAAEESLEDPDFGFRIVMTDPRVAELGIPYRPTRPSMLRREYLIDEEALLAEEMERRSLEAEELGRGPFASRVPDPPRYDLRSISRASTENPSPVTPSVFSRETSGRSSEATSVTATPTGSGYLPSSPALTANRQVVDGNGTPVREGSEEREANMWRKGVWGEKGAWEEKGVRGVRGALEEREALVEKGALQQRLQRRWGVWRWRVWVREWTRVEGPREQGCLEGFYLRRKCPRRLKMKGTGRR